MFLAHVGTVILGVQNREYIPPSNAKRVPQIFLFHRFTNFDRFWFNAYHDRLWTYKRCPSKEQKRHWLLILSIKLFLQA